MVPPPPLCLPLEWPRPLAPAAGSLLVLNPKQRYLRKRWLAHHYPAASVSPQHWVRTELNVIVLFSVPVPLGGREVAAQDHSQIWGWTFAPFPRALQLMVP